MHDWSALVIEDDVSENFDESLKNCCLKLQLKSKRICIVYQQKIHNHRSFEPPCLTKDRGSNV